MEKRTLIGERLAGFLEKEEELNVDINNLEIKEIPLDRINNPKFHDRKVFSEAEIIELAENIKEYGLAHPIVVRKTKNGYERIIGFRRIEAFKYLGKEKIPALVLDIPEDKAIALMLSENIQREDLSEYDKVLAQVQYLTMKFGFDSEESLVKFIFRISNYRLGNVRDLSEEEKEKAVKLQKEIENLTGKSLKTFIDRIHILRVHPLIKDAIRRNRWSYTIALTLNKLATSGKIKELEELIKKAENNQYGYAKIKEEVDTILNKPKRVSFSSFSKKLTKVYPKLPKEKKKLIDEKLKEIYEIIGE